LTQTLLTVLESRSSFVPKAQPLKRAVVQFDRRAVERGACSGDG
jgi:hypothetical protein